MSAVDTSPTTVMMLRSRVVVALVEGDDLLAVELAHRFGRADGQVSVRLVAEERCGRRRAARRCPDRPRWPVMLAKVASRRRVTSASGKRRMQQDVGEQTQGRCRDLC